MKTQIVNVTKRLVNKIAEKSPEILLVGGVAGMIGAAILACKATSEVKESVEDAKTDLDLLKNAPTEFPDRYTEEEAARMSKSIKKDIVGEVAKAYAPSIIVGGVSVAMIFSSNKLMRKRVVALATACSAISTSFSEYRQRVAEKYGQEVADKLMYKTKEIEVEEQITDKNGKVKTKKTKIQAIDPKSTDYCVAVYSPITSSHCDGRESVMYMELMAAQNYFNYVLIRDKHVFLNDILDYLGMEKTKAGQVTGWVLKDNNKEGDNLIDFGCFAKDLPNDVLYSKFQENSVKNVLSYDGTTYKKGVLLNFNCDGTIMEKVFKK